MEQPLRLYGPSPSFIAGRKIDPNICDGLIDYFHESKMKVPGATGAGVDPTCKDSIDVASLPLHKIRPSHRDPRLISYFQELSSVSSEYSEMFPYLKEMVWSMFEEYNIQWYPKNGGFHKLHCEQDHGSKDRLLVWMTYLNDIEEDGETWFEYQQLKIKPEKGLTVIWPAAFTHVHKGIPAPNEEKMIITGWYSYPS